MFKKAEVWPQRRTWQTWRTFGRLRSPPSWGDKGTRSRCWEAKCFGEPLSWWLRLAAILSHQPLGLQSDV